MGTHDPEDPATSRMYRDGTWSAVAMPAGWKVGFGVSCTSPTFCMAIDAEGKSAIWDGSAWSSADPVGSAAFDFDCASPTFCTGVTATGTTELWNGATWTAAPADSDLDVTSISCPATNDCWVGTEESQVAHFDGTTWSAAEKIAPTGVDGFNTMTVSCPTSAACGAADQHGNVYRYAHGAWGHHAHVGDRISGDIGAFDCGSATSCTAVLSHVGDVGKVVRWNGTSWTTSRALPRGYAGIVESLSCATKKACVMTDANGTAWVRS